MNCNYILPFPPFTRTMDTSHKKWCLNRGVRSLVSSLSQLQLPSSQCIVLQHVSSTAPAELKFIIRTPRHHFCCTSLYQLILGREPDFCCFSAWNMECVWTVKCWHGGSMNENGKRLDSMERKSMEIYWLQSGGTHRTGRWCSCCKPAKGHFKAHSRLKWLSAFIQVSLSFLNEQMSPKVAQST